MSIDSVDDLHAAEDRIGTLEHAGSELLGALRIFADTGDAAPLAPCISNLKAVIEDTYCRPSCYEDCDEDCGCPAHEEGEPHHEPDEDEDGADV